MQVITSVSAMQRLGAEWKRGSHLQIGFVPTMGYLHAGHISLVREARKRVGSGGRVVVSIYVNPTQFAPNEDLAKYPRDLERDKALCREAGVDALFVPGDKEMYPVGYGTYVQEESLSKIMEGVTRPTHFRGVTTVVAKLFNIVQPDVAVFGAKDFQQATIIQRMVQDLNFPLKIVVAPIVREKDGLAMSSRNKYLSPENRVQAVILSKLIAEAKKLVKAKPVPAVKLRVQLARKLAEAPAARLDYIEFFDPRTLEPRMVVKPGVQMALAVFFDKTRLIDNGRL